MSAPGPTQVGEGGGVVGLLVDARAQEQGALHGGVGDEMDHGRSDRARAQRQEHEAELARGRGRQQTLEVALRDGHQPSDEGGDAADRAHQEQRARREQRQSAHQQHDPRDDERRGVQQRRDRRGPPHGVLQPPLEGNLRRLAHRRDQQQQRGDRGRRPTDVERPGDRRRPRVRHEDEDAEVEAEIGRARHQEGARRRARHAGTLEPEADEQIRGEADQLVGGQKQYPVAGEYERLHRRDEEGHFGVEARVVAVAAHVADGVDEHAQCDDGDGRL